MPISRRSGYPEEDRLPWLEDAPPRHRAGPPLGRVLLGLAVVLVLVAAGFAALHLVRNEGIDGGSDAALIRAPEGPYKVRPADPGGMSVEGSGSSAFVASEGGDPRGAIDLSAVAEAPLTRGKPAADAVAAEPAPRAADGTAAGSIQLGAFSTEAKANAAWKAMAQRFAFLQPLTPVILPARSGDATIYRLRAPAGVNAQAMCGRLRVAGETCLVTP